MKVLFWTDGFWPRLGGIETQAMHFIQGMQKRGHEYQVFAQKDHPSWKEEDLVNQILVRRFDFNSIINKKQLKNLKVIQEYLEKVMQDFRPEVIHLNASVGGSVFAFLLFLKIFRCPIISTVHAPYLHEGHFPVLIKNISPFVQQICCVSNWVFEEIKKHLPEQKEKIRRIYNGLDSPNKANTLPCFSPPHLLLLGRLSKEKGFDVAIRAFASVLKQHKSCQLILAGDGPERKSLEMLARELEIPVQFLGIVTEEEKWALFDKAAFVIVPSLIESFGLVILEAMQRGRAVIASNIEGVPEVLEDGKTGILVPPQDPLALSYAIKTLLKDPKKSIQMGKNGFKRAKLFTLEPNLDQYEKNYEMLICP